MSKPANKPISILGWVVIKLIRLYQLFLSPFLGANCRYFPTCSAYAIESVLIHGGLRGGWLALRRLGRCHPWGGVGYDPVPEKISDTKICVTTKASTDTKACESGKSKKR